jgi:hypothetical protein
MSASHMSSTEYLLQKTYQILCFFLYSFEMLQTPKRNSLENKLKSDQMSFTVLMIQLSSDCRWK